MENNRLLNLLGVVALFAAIVYIVKSINRITETKLYSNQAILDLSDDNKYKEIEKKREEAQSHLVDLEA